MHRVHCRRVRQLSCDLFRQSSDCETTHSSETNIYILRFFNMFVHGLLKTKLHYIRLLPEKQKTILMVESLLYYRTVYYLTLTEVLYFYSHYEL